MSGELFLYGGVAAVVLSAVGAAAAVIAFTISGRKLKRQLFQEYGPKRR